MSKKTKSSSDLKGANKGINSVTELIQLLHNSHLDNLICDLNTELEVQKDAVEFLEFRNLGNDFQDWLENKHRIKNSTV